VVGHAEGPELFAAALLGISLSHRFQHPEGPVLCCEQTTTVLILGTPVELVDGERQAGIHPSSDLPDLPSQPRKTVPVDREEANAPTQHVFCVALDAPRVS